MKCSLVSLCVALLLSSPAAWGQSSGGDGSSGAGGYTDRPPADNVRGGAVRERAPGRIVDFARARHLGLRDARLAAQRTGDTAALAPEPAAAGGLGGSLSSLLGGSFSSLLNTFLNSGLSGALGGQGGTSGSDFSNLPPEVLQMLADAGISLSDLNQKQREDSGAESVDLAKSSSRAQTSGGQEQPRFIVRWADAMLSTFFTAITVGFQTQDFIGLLKDAFRPLFIPPETSSDGSNGSSDGGSNGGQNGGNGGGGGGGGGLI
jgi:hypothetical protein